MIADHRTGLLVPPSDSPSLGAALGRLFTDAALREQLARAGQASVLPRFGIDKYVESVTQLYDRLLGRVAA